MSLISSSRWHNRALETYDSDAKAIENARRKSTSQGQLTEASAEFAHLRDQAKTLRHSREALGSLVLWFDEREDENEELANVIGATTVSRMSSPRHPRLRTE